MSSPPLTSFDEIFTKALLAVLPDLIEQTKKEFHKSNFKGAWPQRPVCLFHGQQCVDNTHFNKKLELYEKKIAELKKQIPAYNHKRPIDNTPIPSLEADLSIPSIFTSDQIAKAVKRFHEQRVEGSGDYLVKITK